MCGLPDTLSLEWLRVSVKPVKDIAVSVAVVGSGLSPKRHSKLLGLLGAVTKWRTAALRAPLSALNALEPSSRASGKGLGVENTHAETDRHTDL